MKSTTDTPGFSTQPPAWERGVSVTQTQASLIFRARSGLEQRQSIRHRPTWKLDYTAVLPSAAVARARRATTYAEMTKAHWLPWWPDEFAAAGTAPTGAGSLILTQDPGDDQFLPGEYLAFDAEPIEFRPITARSGRTLTLGGTGTAHTAGTRLWPAKLCIRTRGEVRRPGAPGNEESHAWQTLQ